MAVIALDKRLLELVDEDIEVEKIATGYGFTEGPVWHHREKVLTFSDIPGNAQHRWTRKGGAVPWRTPSMHANGSTLDSKGRLITCHHDRVVTRTNADNSVETIASEYKGSKLNSPNDVICTKSGDLIFTDPTFGMRQPDGSMLKQETSCLGVYRLSPDGQLTLLIDDFTAPNGLVISDDQKRLYVDDTREAHVRVFNVNDDGSVSGGRVFCEIKQDGKSAGAPDGMKLDSRGNLYLAANGAHGIWVFDPEGHLLGNIGVGDEPRTMGGAELVAPVGGGPANLAWGEDDWSTMFVTAVTSVYRIRMKVSGQPVGV